MQVLDSRTDIHTFSLFESHDTWFHSLSRDRRREVQMEKKHASGAAVATGNEMSASYATRPRGIGERTLKASITSASRPAG